MDAKFFNELEVLKSFYFLMIVVIILILLEKTKNKYKIKTHKNRTPFVHHYMIYISIHCTYMSPNTEKTEINDVKK